jgi:predicted nucleotidyltransferase
MKNFPWMGTMLNISKEKLADLCNRHRVQELLLFGSALTDRFRDESDIDLLVTFRPDARVGFLALARVQHELEDLLGRQVDLVPKGGLKPAIRDSVLATAQVLYAA